MKRIISIILLLLFLLSACAPQAPVVHPTTGTTAPTVPLSDPYIGMSAEEFYSNYQPATSLQDALYRSKHGFLSGSLEVPEQNFTRADDQPITDGLYVHNTERWYEDNGNTYVVTDAKGNAVMRIYKGGAYITLEEVAAYMYAFGGDENLPANHTTKKNGKPAGSIWGQYLRLNHSWYKNNPERYPYEPELPGNGAGFRYYEMDIGTTGTSTPGYVPRPYNNGKSIVRGAARLVYTKKDLNGNGTFEPHEIFVFYTHNHYNDFTEYLNYYGGWGETFGNVTGGGVFDSKTECNPTPYPQVIYASLLAN